MRIALLALAGSVIVLATPAQAQIYLKIEGVDGESKDSKHLHWIEVASVQLAGVPADNGAGAAAKVSPSPVVTSTPPTAVKTAPTAPEPSRTGKANPGSPEISKVAVQHSIVSPRDPQSGLPTGKRMHQALTITKQADKASPILMQALATNRQFKEIVIEFYRSGTLSQRYRLRDAIISSFKQSAAIKASDAKPAETMTLVASEVVQER